jgi:hydrogenase expression/formation protein HypC
MTTPGCITCRDYAALARMIALFEQHMATVDTGCLGEKVSVELVDARIGDLVLVHAGMAIGTLDELA